ncbi:MAG: hypothetical protein RLZZ316_451 [Bacteroidota bacterium]|jgi:hypothetical protein
MAIGDFWLNMRSETTNALIVFNAELDNLK